MLLRNPLLSVQFVVYFQLADSTDLLKSLKLVVVCTQLLWRSVRMFLLPIVSTLCLWVTIRVKCLEH